MGNSAAAARRRIGELAAELGLNPKTIRYYEDIGLMPEPPRTAAGYRLYGEVDRERLEFILKARAIGLTLEEIHQILALRSQGQPPASTSSPSSTTRSRRSTLTYGRWRTSARN